jgi:sterol desaturase/sphingolipid hydroxylase (fatty acid hydroxylase superfamily)
MVTIAGLSEPVVRFGAFAVILTVMAALELAMPKRELRASKPQRWLTNLSIVALGMAATRLMALVAAPLAAVAAALIAEANGWGLFNLIGLPPVVEIILAIVILDLAIWLQHLLSHRVPMLWRVHQMHHADVDFDVTTALRFHPVEIVLSMLYKVVVVLILGPAALAVVLFEILLNGCAMFNHANIDLPRSLDRVLRLILVTPDMHRVHHSVLRHEHDSNYGFNFSIWDRLFGTYTDQPAGGHQAMTIGLAPYQTASPSRLGWSLALPFRRPPR